MSPVHLITYNEPCIKSEMAKFNAKSVKAMRLAKSEMARHAAKCVRQPGFLKLAA